LPFGGAENSGVGKYHGKGLEEWQPLFTYHGYRYIEVTGFPEKPNPDALTGLVVYSEVPNIVKFSCSNELINKVQQNILWGQASNICTYRLSSA